jgi:cell division septum initiation protein DivIVA
LRSRASGQQAAAVTGERRHRVVAPSCDGGRGGRIAKLNVEAVGLVQHIDRLKVQQAELAVANREKADRLASARQSVAAAEDEAKQIISRAKQQADDLLMYARIAASKIQDDASNALNLRRELDAIVNRLRSLPAA